MPRYVAFLRAINVGGHTVKMDVLKAHFESLGLTQVETFIASGNVIFDTRAKTAAGIETKIERTLEDALGYAVTTFLRTLSEVSAIARHKPFPVADMADAAALNVGMLKEPLGSAAAKKLSTLRTDVDDFHLHGAELYWICKKKQSESKVSNALFERALGVKATFRGMRTMERLASKYPG